MKTEMTIKTRQIGNKTRVLVIGVLLVASGSLMLEEVNAQSRFNARGAAVNEDGGFRRGSASGFSTGNDSGAARYRRGVSDGEGNIRGSSAGVFIGPNGSQGSRATRFQRNSDGSAEASGTASWRGANGSRIDRSGSANYDPDSGLDANRSTEATGASGNSFEGSSSYNRDDGYSRQGSCYDASGNEISCSLR